MIKRYRSRMTPYLHGLVGVTAVTVLVYGSRISGPAGVLVWNLYLLPIAFMAFRWGLGLGLATGGLSLVCLFPALLPALLNYGVSLHTVAHVATAVLFLSFPLVVDSVASPRRRQTELEKALFRVNSLLEERLSMDSLAALILREAMDSCQAGYGFLYLRDRSTGSFELAGSLGYLGGPEDEEIRSRLESPAMKQWVNSATAPTTTDRGDELPPDLADGRTPDGGMACCVFASVPLWSGDTHFGVIALVRPAPGACDRDSIEALQSIARTGQIALEQAWLHGELERNAAELSTLNELGRAAGASLDLKETVENVVASLQQTFPDFSIELLYRDDVLADAELRARGQGGQIEYLDPGHQPEGLLATMVMAAHRPLATEDLRAIGMPLPDGAVQGEGFGCFFGLPLAVGSKTIGALCLYGPGPDPVSARERRLLRAAGVQVAVALSNAGLHGRTDQQLSRKLVEISILQGLAKEFNATLELDQLLRLVLRQSLLLTAADHGAIALGDQETGELHPRVASGAAQEISPEAEGLLRQVTESATPLLENGDGDKGSVPRSRLCVPIRRLSRTVGAIYLESSRPRAFSQADAQFLSLLAEHGAIAIENARLYAESTARTRDVEQLLNVSKILSSTVDLDEVLRILTATMVTSLQVAFCHISLLIEKGEVLVIKARAVASPQADSPARDGAQFPLDRVPRFREVVRSGRPLLVRQELPETAFRPEEQRLTADGDTKSALLVPLVLKERILGVIAVGEHRRWDRSPITPEKVDLCQAMASQAAVAIENAQLFKAMAEEQKRTEHILTDMADGVFTTNRQRRILSFNPAAERITGWKRGEVIGRFCCDVMRPSEGPDPSCSECCPLLESMERRRVAKIGPVAWEVSGRRSHRLQAACSVSPLDDGDGNTVGAVSIFRDVTREAELDQLKSDFVSMVSHELRSPLAGIAASAELLRHNPNGHRSDHLLEVIHTQAMQLGGFVEDVLSVSRLERGGLDLHPEPVALVPILKQLIATTQATTSRHRIQLKVKEEPPLVMADAGRVEIVVGNLLRNAVNYSPRGGPITVEARREGQEVVVGVEDRGIGVPEDQMERIFERFSRADNRDAKTVYGHGLGLYIARGIVERLGGRIWVESRIGQGSRFYFTLPVYEEF